MSSSLTQLRRAVCNPQLHVNAAYPPYDPKSGSSALPGLPQNAIAGPSGTAQAKVETGITMPGAFPGPASVSITDAETAAAALSVYTANQLLGPASSLDLFEGDDGGYERDRPRTQHE